jgi:hypothetical protein
MEMRVPLPDRNQYLINGIEEGLFFENFLFEQLSGIFSKLSIQIL